MLRKLKLQGKGRGRIDTKAKLGATTAQGMFPNLLSLPGVYVPCGVVLLRMLLVCVQQQHSLYLDIVSAVAAEMCEVSIGASSFRGIRMFSERVCATWWK